MQWEVSLIPVNEYSPEELVQDLPPEKYMLDDAGQWSLATTSFSTESIVPQLIQFLFQTSEYPAEIYRDDQSYILDLSPMKDRLIQFDQLETLYPNWLETTGRSTSMSEYGMLIDFVGFGRKENKRSLLMVVSDWSKRIIKDQQSGELFSPTHTSRRKKPRWKFW